MKELIDQITKSLGIDEQTATSVTGGLLGAIKKEGDPNLVSQLFQKLPGAEALVGQAAGGGGGGMLGGLMGSIGKATGMDLGGAAGLAGLLSKSGLKSDQIGSLVTMFLSFLKSKAGAELVEKVVAQVPALKQLVP